MSTLAGGLATGRLGRAPAVLRGLAISRIVRIQSRPFYRRMARIVRPRFLIEEATAGDLRKVHEWVNPGAEMPLARRGAGAVHFVAKSGCRIVGFTELVMPEGLQGSPFEGFWLFSLRVWTPFRGMGIGEALVRAVVERARIEGGREVRLIVRSDNHPAIALNRKLGFAQTSASGEVAARLEGMRGLDGVPRIVMSLSLAEEGPGKAIRSNVHTT